MVSVREWIEDSLENGVSDFCVADWRLVKESVENPKLFRGTLRHCRSGKLPKDRIFGDFAGKHVLAYGFDDVGNPMVFMRNGDMRQILA